MVRRHRVKNKRGGRKMRTLEEIREENKRKDMLFTGMESKCVSLPPEVIKEGKNFFNNYVKPTVRRVIKRQLLKGNL